ncbi:MAG: hypothetical protein SPF07_02320 [Eubacteriales bacterium]|nr:hypothetical protein [Eubacteriales bacterium]
MKYKNKKYGFKKFLVGGMLALSVFSTSFLVSNFENNNSPIYAHYTEQQTSISNNDFTSYSTSSNPYSPNSWTFTNPANNDNIKYGVINVSDSSFSNNKDDYELENPVTPAPGNITEGSNDTLYKHLMINSYAGLGRAGYTSTSFTLNANSYYSIAITVRTNDKAKASVYLSGLSDSKVDASIKSISTNEAWETYEMFVETNAFTSETATLELWLGSKDSDDNCQGAVFFNKVTLTRYSETSYRTKVASADTTRSKQISLYNPIYETPINNPSFDATSVIGDSSPITGWSTIEASYNENQMLKVITTNNYHASIDTEKGIANPGTNFKASDDSVLFMYNKTDGAQGIKSNEFTIKQNELYLISVWAKSDCAKGSGATVKLEQVNEDEEDEDFKAVTATLTTATSLTTDATTNNWTQYKLFVEGHPLQDTKVTLQLWLGTEDAKTSGYVFFDNITVQKISYKDFSDANSSGTNATYTYNADNTQFTIVNGNFNVTQKSEKELTYPLTASNWTLTSDENYNQEYNLTGVINTKTDQFQILKDYINTKGIIDTPYNPGLTPVQKIVGATLDNSSNNVLMIGNTTTTTQSYKSEDFSLTASSYYKISMLVNTQYENPSLTKGAKITLDSSAFTAMEIGNIDTNGQWKQIDMFVHVGSKYTTFNLTLALNNIKGYVFFDDVVVAESSETEFNKALTENQYKVELNLQSSDTFDVHSQSDTALSTLFNWTSTNNSETSGVVYGALDTTKNINEVFTGITNPGSVNGTSILALQSINDAYFTLTSSQKIDLSIDKYYEIAVKIKTRNINKDVKKYDDNGSLIKYGAFIGLDGYDDMFTAIDTERDLEDGYVTYSFLIKPTEDTQTNVILGIGGEDNWASGYVFVDDIVVSELSEANYTEASENANIRTLILSKQSTTTDDTESGTEFTGSEFNWVLVPSILTSLAIIIAIVGTTVRKFKFTKTPKIKTKYDRRKTVEVDLDKRERIELRNEIIKELNNEYNDIDKEINDLVKQFEQEKADALKLQEEKLKAYEEVKQAIIIEREKVTREYNNKLNATENLTEQDKSKYEKEFKAYIKKLDKRAAVEAKKYNKKDNTIQVIEIKHNQKVKELSERQKYIQEEIARIEKEIEEIAKQEEIMWNEYRKAKEEAKKEKLAYLAEKRKAKEEAKAKKHNHNNQPSETTEDTTPSENTTEVEIEEPKTDAVEENTEDVKEDSDTNNNQ